MSYNKRDDSIYIGKTREFDPSKIITGTADRKTGDYINTIGDTGLQVKPESQVTVKEQRGHKKDAENSDNYFYAEITRKQMAEALQKLAFGEVKIPVEGEHK